MPDPNQHLIEIRGFLPFIPTRTESLLEHVLLNNGISLANPQSIKSYKHGLNFRRLGIDTKTKKAIEYSRFGDPDSGYGTPSKEIAIKTESGLILPHIFNFYKDLHNQYYFDETVRFELFDYNEKPFESDIFQVWIKNGKLDSIQNDVKREGIRFLQAFLNERYQTPWFPRSMPESNLIFEEGVSRLDTVDFMLNIVDFYFGEFKLLKD